MTECRFATQLFMRFPKGKKKGRIKVLFPDEMLLKGLQSLIELS